MRNKKEMGRGAYSSQRGSYRGAGKMDRRDMGRMGNYFPRGEKKKKQNLNNLNKTNFHNISALCL